MPSPCAVSIFMYYHKPGTCPQISRAVSFCFTLCRTTTSMAVSLNMSFHLQLKQTTPCHRRAAVHGSLSKGHGELTIARTSRTKKLSAKNGCDMSKCSTSQEWVSKCFKIIIGETPQHKSTILLQTSTDPVDPSMRNSYFQGFPLRPRDGSAKLQTSNANGSIMIHSGR